MAEQGTHKPLVDGSNPFLATKWCYSVFNVLSVVFNFLGLWTRTVRLDRMVPRTKARSDRHGLGALLFGADERIDLYLRDEVGRCLELWIDPAGARKDTGVNKPLHRFDGAVGFFAEYLESRLRDRHVADLCFGHQVERLSNARQYSPFSIFLSTGPGRGRGPL